MHNIITIMLYSFFTSVKLHKPNLLKSYLMHELLKGVLFSDAQEPIGPARGRWCGLGR